MITSSTKSPLIDKECRIALIQPAQDDVVYKRVNAFRCVLVCNEKLNVLHDENRYVNWDNHVSLQYLNMCTCICVHVCDQFKLHNCTCFLKPNSLLSLLNELFVLLLFTDRW